MDGIGQQAKAYVRPLPTKEKIYSISHGYNGGPWSVCYTILGKFLLSRVKSIEPLKVVRYSRSGSEMQTIQNDPVGNLVSVRLIEAGNLD